MISFPEQFNMATYFLDDRIKEGKGDRVAVYYKDKKYTYSDIQLMANRMGNVLLSLGIEMEDRVLISLPDCPEFVATWFAIAKIGAVITMINGGTGQETSRSSSGTILNGIFLNSSLNPIPNTYLTCWMPYATPGMPLLIFEGRYLQNRGNNSVFALTGWPAIRLRLWQPPDLRQRPS